jgi:hypothetical protein
LNWLCEKYGDLPEEGGILDQEYAVIHTMQVLSNVYNVVQKYISSYGERIHQLTEADRMLLRRLKDAKLMFED